MFARFSKAGARGYILKDAIDTELISAIQSVARGDGYISPAISGTLLSDDPAKHHQFAGSAFVARARGAATHRRRQNQQRDAILLNLSVYTVDSHRGKIMEKLNLHSTGELVRFAMKQGLVD